MEQQERVTVRKRNKGERAEGEENEGSKERYARSTSSKQREKSTDQRFGRSMIKEQAMTEKIVAESFGGLFCFLEDGGVSRNFL